MKVPEQEDRRMATQEKTRRLRRQLHSIPGRTVAFLIPMLALLLAAVAWVNHASQEALRDKIVASSEAQVSAAIGQLTYSLDRTMAIQRDLIYDSDVNRLGVTPGYFTQPQKIQAMLRVIWSMSLLAESSPFIQEAAFLAPSIGRVITNVEVNSLSEAEFQRTNEQYLSQGQTFTEMDGKLYLLMPYPSYRYYLDKNGASYFIRAQVDQQALTDFLASHIVSSDEALLLFRDGGELVASVNPEAAAYDLNALFQQARQSSAFDYTDARRGQYLVSAVQGGSGEHPLTLVKLQPYQRAFSVLNSQKHFFVALFILVIVINLLYMLHLWHVIYKPLNKLSKAFEQVERGDFSIRIHHSRDDDFAEIYHSFNHMSERLGDLIEQVYMQTIRTQRAELKQLQSQINPHFLYNNLFMIRSLAQLGDTDMIETLAADLGEYFRYINRTGSQEVPLSMEADHARHYAKLQDMRFSSRIHLAFDPLPEEMKDVIVPRLVLQPLIENAYQHGLKDTMSGGELHVGFQAEGWDAVIVVEDNGPGVTEALIRELTASLSNPDVVETTGMINIHRRLLLRFGAPYGLAFSVSPLGGLRVEMRLPMDGGEMRDAQSADC